MVEENENKLRGDMDSLYVSKTKQIINTGRLREDYMTKDQKSNFHAELAAKMAAMNKWRDNKDLVYN